MTCTSSGTRERTKSTGASTVYRLKKQRSVFYDENAIRYFDPDHSKTEDRYIMLGMSARLRVLVVCHCYREPGDVIRIISARKAEKLEARAYTEGDL